MGCQVSALVDYPDLLEEKNGPVLKRLFAEDAIERAHQLLKAMGGSSGAYSHSQGKLLVQWGARMSDLFIGFPGIPLIREHVAKFIEGWCILGNDGFRWNISNIDEYRA